MAVAGIAGDIIVDGHEHFDDVPLPGNGENTILFVVDEQVVITLVDGFANFLRVRRLEDDAMGMEDSDTKEMIALTHHLQGHLHLAGIADTHGTVDAPLYRLQQEIGAFPGRLDKLLPLPGQVQDGKSTDTENQEDD